MPLATGSHHITVLTGDIEALIAFYGAVFEAEVTLDLVEGPMRHVIIDVGGLGLHAFEFEPGGPEEKASDAMFQRGHIDHFAIALPDAATFEMVRRRLVEAGASEGRVRDFGFVRILSFVDPDGMNAEIALSGQGRPLTMAESTTEAYTP